MMASKRNQVAKLKALQPHLARRVAVTHMAALIATFFEEPPKGSAQQSLGL
jgi:hypothetical protein